jgi:hypothetical protein
MLRGGEKSEEDDVCGESAESMIETDSGGEAEGASEGAAAVKTFETRERVVKGVDMDGWRRDRMTDVQGCDAAFVQILADSKMGPERRKMNVRTKVGPRGTRRAVKITSRRVLKTEIACSILISRKVKAHDRFSVVRTLSQVLRLKKPRTEIRRGYD